MFGPGMFLYRVLVKQHLSDVTPEEEVMLYLAITILFYMLIGMFISSL